VPPSGSGDEAAALAAEIATLIEPYKSPTQKGKPHVTSTPTTLRPLHDRILVKRLEAEGKTAGGLFIPDAAKEKPVEGLVIAVGDGTRNKDGVRIPLDVKTGDRVLFSKYSGTEVKAVGDDHMILREDDILAVIG
jgi:chaperonin GroES